MTNIHLTGFDLHPKCIAFHLPHLQTTECTCINNRFSDAISSSYKAIFWDYYFLIKNMNRSLIWFRKLVRYIRNFFNICSDKYENYAVERIDCTFFIVHAIIMVAIILMSLPHSNYLFHVGFSPVTWCYLLITLVYCH